MITRCAPQQKLSDIGLAKFNSKFELCQLVAIFDINSPAIFGISRDLPECERDWSRYSSSVHKLYGRCCTINLLPRKGAEILV